MAEPDTDDSGERPLVQDAQWLLGLAIVLSFSLPRALTGSTGWWFRALWVVLVVAFLSGLFQTLRKFARSRRTG